MDQILEQVLKARRNQPFIIAVTGGVAVGKSTLSHDLAQALSSLPQAPQVEIVSTDGFLYPTQYLRDHNLMQKKGFPESYDRDKFLKFLGDLRADLDRVEVPLYSHVFYDLTGEVRLLKHPEIVILEGLNLLEFAQSGLIDYTIFVDASLDLMKQWYLERHKFLTEQAKANPQAFFHQFSQIPENERIARATGAWENINRVNYLQNILPYKDQADLVVEKGEGHQVISIKPQRYSICP